MGGPPEGAGPKNGMGGMMGGGMGGMMDGMMEKMGAPKPKDLYPSLMELPDLPIERRGELEQEAHARMIAGTKLLGEGFDEPGVDFVEFTLNSTKDAGLLTIVRNGVVSTAQVGEDNFIVSRDGKSVRFFGGIDDFDHRSRNSGLPGATFERRSQIRRSRRSCARTHFR